MKALLLASLVVGVGMWLLARRYVAFNQSVPLSDYEERLRALNPTEWQKRQLERS